MNLPEVRAVSHSLDEKTVGVWFQSLVIDGRQIGDLLVTLSAAEVGFRSVIRIRIYDPEDPGNDAFSGKDRKMWYEAQSKETSREEAIARMRTFVANSGAALGNGPQPPYDEVLAENDGVDGFLRRLREQPWVHVQEVQAS